MPNAPTPTFYQPPSRPQGLPGSRHFSPHSGLPQSDRHPRPTLAKTTDPSCSMQVSGRDDFRKKSRWLPTGHLLTLKLSIFPRYCNEQRTTDPATTCADVPEYCYWKCSSWYRVFRLFGGIPVIRMLPSFAFMLMRLVHRRSAVLLILALARSVECGTSRITLQCCA